MAIKKAVRKLSAKQMKIASIAGDPKKIDALNLEKLRKGAKKAVKKK